MISFANERMALAQWLILHCEHVRMEVDAWDLTYPLNISSRDSAELIVAPHAKLRMMLL